MKTGRNIAFILLALFFSLGCNKWDYKHQDRWAKHFKDCGSAYQSPIDIDTSITQTDSLLSPLFIDYLPVDTFVVKRNENLIYITHLEGSVTAPDTNFWGHEFFLAQIIFHSPSEHSVNGKKYPAEIQFINIDTLGKFLIVSVLVNEGQSNPVFSALLANIPNKNSQVIVSQTLDINGILPYGVGYWHYMGSMTFPPCHDSVEWYVMKDPIQASKEQLDSLRLVLGNNTRKLQALGNRKIYEF